MNAKLTAKETALLQAIADGQIDFFDDGLVAGSNGWSDVLTDTLAGRTDYIVSKTARGVATVAASICRKGLLTSDNNDEDGASYYITEAGAVVLQAMLAESKTGKFYTAPVEEISETTKVDEIGTPEGEAVVVTWETAGMEDTVYWTEVKFADDSRTLKRRTKVSGSWRTDYFGAEFMGDKERLTTSAKVKEALSRGNFTR